MELTICLAGTDSEGIQKQVYPNKDTENICSEYTKPQPHLCVRVCILMRALFQGKSHLRDIDGIEISTRALLSSSKQESHLFADLDVINVQ